MMESPNIVGVYKMLTDSSIDVWIDGGWRADALLGYQAREHGDMNIMIQKKTYQN
jgi:hypothetical protein